MQNPIFTATIHGKWILTGEHAVVRGHPAIIFPVKDKSLQMCYWTTTDKVQAEFSGESIEALQFLFWSALKQAAEILALPFIEIVGKFRLENTIPIGYGMGGSAAVCVAISKWFLAQKKITEKDLLEFARQLENVFHHESSGADIAVAIANAGIYFSRGSGFNLIKQNWQPRWYLSFSGQSSPTSICVKKVKDLWQRDKKYAEKIDSEMVESVALAEKSLQLDHERGMPLLIEAIQKGYQCFKAWGLLNNGVDEHIQQLFAAGAVAAKPSGSGGGGFIISLWQSEPPKNLAIELIAIS